MRAKRDPLKSPTDEKPEAGPDKQGNKWDGRKPGGEELMETLGPTGGQRLIQRSC